MTRAAARVKSGGGRAKAAPRRAPRKVEAAVGVSHAAVLDAIFDGLPEPVLRDAHAPEVVRRNRRERARRRLLDALEARGPYALTEMVGVELRRTAERWGQKDFIDSFAEAEEFEIRCADERAVLDAAARGDEEGRYAAAAGIHGRRVEKRYGWIEIRGLQVSTRLDQNLEEAYVPLQVEEPPTARPRRKTSDKSLGKKHRSGAGAPSAAAIDAMMHMLGGPRIPATEALAKHDRLVVVGGPGSGKSTLIAYVATRAARGTLAQEVGWQAGLVPFVIPVRALRPDTVTLEGLASVAGVEAWLMEAALRKGQALVLVDGLDEARTEVADDVLPALSRILDTYPKSRAVVTTRPAGPADKDAPLIPGFARVTLTAMTRDEVSTFIDKWCLAAELSLGKVRAHAESDAQAAAADLKQRVRERRAIEKLAQTPLLCSVICVVHRFLGQQIPQRRVVLYEAITNVLLYEWDRAKFPEGSAIGKLDAPAKRALLARLACAMHKAKVAELPEAEVVRRFEAHLPDLGRPKHEARAIIAEIRDRSGVLVERTPGSFGFSHMTFQEYLTALELVNGRKYDYLIRRYEDEWWHEVIVLAAGFPGSDAAHIVGGLLEKDGDEVGVGTMLAAQCVETAIELPESMRTRVQDLVAKRVPPRTREDAVWLMRSIDVSGPVLLREYERCDAAGKDGILLVIGVVKYEPALALVCRALSDTSTFSQRAENSPVGESYEGGVSADAAQAAVAMIEASELALLPLMHAIAFATPLAVDMLRHLEPQPRPHRIREQIRALIQRYEETHPRAGCVWVLHSPASTARPTVPRTERTRGAQSAE